MAYTSSAYRLDAYPDYASARSRDRRRAEFQVIHQGGSASPSASLLPTLAKMAALVLVVVAALSFGRIALTNEAVTTMIESDALSSQIAEARSSGIGLEMEQSVLSNTSAVNAAAKRLGMAAPAEVGTIALAPDVVAVTPTGSLSLSDTVKNAAAIQR